MKLNDIRKTLRDNNLADESDVLHNLITEANLSEQQRIQIADDGAALVRKVRANSDPTLMENFLGEFGFSTEEGIALINQFVENLIDCIEIKVLIVCEQACFEFHCQIRH